MAGCTGPQSQGWATSLSLRVYAASCCQIQILRGCNAHSARLATLDASHYLQHVPPYHFYRKYINSHKNSTLTSVSWGLEGAAGDEDREFHPSVRLFSPLCVEILCLLLCYLSVHPSVYFDWLRLPGSVSAPQSPLFTSCYPSLWLYLIFAFS